jgi:hypothetical protein
VSKNNKGKNGLDHSEFKMTRESFKVAGKLDYFEAHFYEKNVGNVTHMSDNQRVIWDKAIAMMDTIGEIKDTKGQVYKASGYCKKA